MSADALRVLTVRQPWAWAIIHGGKDVENRVRSLGPYRGPVAIHAGLALDHEYHAHLIGKAVGRLARSTRAGLDLVAKRAGDTRTPGNEITERFGNLGAVIGVVDLVGEHRGHQQEDAEAWEPDEYCDIPSVLGPRPKTCSPWALPDHHHLELANPRPLTTPIPARGRLGLWRPDPDLTAAILAALPKDSDHA